MPITVDELSPKRIGVDIDLETYQRSLRLIEYRLRAPVVRAMYSNLLDLLERSDDRRMTCAAVISGFIKLALSGKDNDLLKIIKELAACNDATVTLDNPLKDLIFRARSEMRKLEGIAEIANENRPNQDSIPSSSI